MGDLLDRDADIATVRQLAGHADLLHVPYRRRSLGGGRRERGPAVPVLPAPILDPDPVRFRGVPRIAAHVAHPRRGEGHDGAAHRRLGGDDEVAAAAVEAAAVRVPHHTPAIIHARDQPVQQPPARGDGVAVGAHRPAALRRGERQVRPIDRDRLAYAARRHHLDRHHLAPFDSPVPHFRPRLCFSVDWSRALGPPEQDSPAPAVWGEEAVERTGDSPAGDRAGRKGRQETGETTGTSRGEALRLAGAPREQARQTPRHNIGDAGMYGEAW